MITLEFIEIYKHTKKEGAKNVAEIKNTIKLNGRVYDARTGQLFVGRTTNHKPKNSKQVGSQTVIDGFITAQKTHLPVTNQQAADHKHIVRKQAHSTAKHARRHKVQHARTLMRSGLKRPATNSHVFKADIIPDAGTVEDVNDRFKRAKHIPQSKLITRFGGTTGAPTIIKRTAHIQVKQPPKPEVPINGHVSSPIITPEAQHNTSDGPIDIFASAISASTSHQEKSAKKTKRRHKLARKLRISNKVMDIVVSSMVIVTLVGFFGAINAPNLEMRVAASRANVHARLPGYSPSGFGMKSIKYGSGQVTVSFLSNSDSRNYQISQTVSSLSSEALKDTYVAQTNLPYQEHQENGITVYTYGDGNATWVNGGVWYQIAGNSSMTSSQLLKIADSF